MVSGPREVVTGRVDPPATPATPKVTSKVDQAGMHDKPLPRDPLLSTAEVELNRAPADVRATIQRFWADGLDAPTIAARLAEHGVTIQNVLVERYLFPGTGTR